MFKLASVCRRMPGKWAGLSAGQNLAQNLIELKQDKNFLEMLLFLYVQEVDAPHKNTVGTAAAQNYCARNHIVHAYRYMYQQIAANI